jgi:hypothetical protein
MHALFFIVVGVLLLPFAAVNGVLMVFSPRRHAFFLRWCSRSKGQTSEVKAGPQIQVRIAGLLILALTLFFGWIFVGKIIGN